MLWAANKTDLEPKYQNFFFFLPTLVKYYLNVTI